ncbi:hypothetical protein DXG01_011746 [Tephrocybe rancida]|nr:hypothetical protein DXG01_011746 [Tephrocybe rancida]
MNNTPVIINPPPSLPRRHRPKWLKKLIRASRRGRSSRVSKVSTQAIPLQVVSLSNPASATVLSPSSTSNPQPIASIASVSPPSTSTTLLSATPTTPMLSTPTSTPSATTAGQSKRSWRKALLRAQPQPASTSVPVPAPSPSTNSASPPTTAPSTTAAPTPLTNPGNTLLNLIVKEAGITHFTRTHALGALTCMAASLMVDASGLGSSNLKVIAQLPAIDKEKKRAGQRAEDVLAQSIAAAKMMVNVGEALLVPYVKAGAGLVLALLELWQLVRKNFADYEEIVQTIRERAVLLRVCPQLVGSEKHLTALMTMLDTLHSTMKTPSFLSHIWKNYSIGRTLLQMKGELTNLQMLNMIEATSNISNTAHTIKTLMEAQGKPKSPQVPLSISALEREEYRTLIPGEIQLQRWVPDALGVPTPDSGVNIHIRNATVVVDGQAMMGRYYESGEGMKRMDADLEVMRKMRGAHVLQLFGICAAALRPCLEGEAMTPISEQQLLKLIHPLKYLAFTWQLFEGYDLAHSYLRAQLPASQCMSHPRPKERMYFTGCPCPPTSAEPHPFHLESYANEYGKLVLSLQSIEPSAPRPKAIQRQGFDFSTRKWKDDPILAQTLDPFGPPEHPTDSSRKHALKAFYAAMLLQGYAGPSMPIPPLPAFGDIWELPNMDHLDDVSDCPERGGTARRRGRVQWPGAVTYGRKEREGAVEWDVGEGAVWEDDIERGYRRKEAPQVVDGGIVIAGTNAAASSSQPTSGASPPGTSTSSISGGSNTSSSSTTNSSSPATSSSSLETSDADIQCTISISLADLARLGPLYLAQATWLRKEILADPDSTSTLAMLTDVKGRFAYQPSFTPKTLDPLHRAIDIDKVYLYVEHPKLSKCAPMSTPKCFWSKDLNPTPMGESEMRMLGLDVPKIEMSGECICWTATQLRGVDEYHKLSGYEPGGDEVVKYVWGVVPKFVPVQDNISGADTLVEATVETAAMEAMEAGPRVLEDLEVVREAVEVVVAAV